MLEIDLALPGQLFHRAHEIIFRLRK